MTTLPTKTRLLAAATALAAASIAVGTAGPASATTLPACGNTSLAVSPTPSTSAGGHARFVVLFRNVSHATCTLYGYPGLDALDRYGHVMAHAQRTLNGYMGGPSTETLVTVAPGRYASAIVEWLLYNPVTTGDCRFSASVATTPANTTHTTRLPVSVSICRLQVHPTIAGASGFDAYDRARLAWLQSATVANYLKGQYWLQAAADLQAAHEYPTQVAQLKQLTSLPDAQPTPAQRAQEAHLVNALDAFFITPGQGGY
jgi:hypothetical protein